MRKVLLIIFIMCIFPLMAFAKSMFAIGSMYSAPLTTILAYDLQHEGIRKQEILNIPTDGSGAYEMCMDAENELLFISFISSNKIECVNAKLFTSYGYSVLDEISNPAAIRYNNELGVLYALEKNTNHLFTYTWNIQDTSFTLQGNAPYYTALTDVAHGCDLAFDSENSVIYVADSSQTHVHYFSAYDLSHVGSVDITQKTTSIAVNDGKYLYSATHDYGSKILQYDLTTNAIRSYYLAPDARVVKMAVDDMTGNLFASLSTTSGINSILVLDDLLDESYFLDDEEVVHPAGICVPDQDIGYNPFDLEKDDDVFTWISPDNIMRYTISYNNLLNYPLENVIITDWLPSDQHVSVHDISDDGVYDQQEHTVTWEVGTLLQGGIEQEVWVEVRVHSGIQTPDTLINYCTIGNDLMTTTRYEETLVKSKKPVTQSYFEPNPFNPELNGGVGIAHLNFSDKDSPINKIKIFDLSGELVIEEKELSLQEVTWNGKNEAGRHVANGVYFMIVCNEAGEKQLIKIAVLR